MKLGLFDLPAPVFAWLDAWEAHLLPPLWRLVVWGFLGALVSMGLYRYLSAQERIARGKREIVASRQRLYACDGEFQEAWPLMRDMLSVALRQVGRIALPAIVASLPLISLLTWLSTHYGYGYPPQGEAPTIEVVPAALQGQWVEQPSAGQPAAPSTPHIVVTDDGNNRVTTVALEAPVPTLHKYQWWNLLLGNPAGYLPDDSPVQRISLELPEKEFLSFGPSWIRGWEFSFFVSLLVVSIAMKVLIRIE